MNIIIILIGISLSIAVGFLILFIWNIKSGQYEDTYTPSIRILFEDKKKEPKDKESNIEKSIFKNSITPSILEKGPRGWGDEWKGF